MVHWWDAYLPSKEEKATYSYRSAVPYSIQYQDVNRDGVYNDALVWYEFSTQYPFNPLAVRGNESNPSPNYRLHRPSARFYGGMVARFTNVSHITKKDADGKRVPFFDRFQQATVQPTEGAKPCSYSTLYPHDIARMQEYDNWLSWSDITMMVVNKGGECCPLSEKFQSYKNAQVNFTATFLWKKADFLNGGATTDKITFDSTSRLSFDISRQRFNVDETRFLIQDGEQLWISEGTTQVVMDKDGDQRWVGVAGLDAQDLGEGRVGAIITLNPFQARWAPYNPAAENEIQTLYTELQAMNYNPKKTIPEEEQAHHEKSDKLLQAVNRMELSPSTATFVEHAFTDVQAVGVYFATYQFIHKPLQMVFDNFQVYATGNIPKGKAVEMTSPDNSASSLSTTTQLTGGISVNCGPFEQTVRQCLCDQVTVRGDITVPPEQVGKPADIVVYAASKSSPEDTAETFYMLGDNGSVLLWDGQPANLVPFQTNVILQPQHPVEMYQGQFALPGFLRVFFGYRLPDGTVVTNADSIDILINSVNEGDYNQMPYCESIKNQCAVRTGSP